MGAEFAAEFEKLWKPERIQTTLQWVTPRLLLQNVQYDRWKLNSTVTWKTMDTFTNCRNSSEPWIPEKIVPKTWYQRLSRMPTLCPFSTASHYKKIENPNLKLEIEFVSRSMIHPLGRIKSHSVHWKFLNSLKLLPENHQDNEKILNRLRLSVVLFIEKNWSKSFNEGLVYNRAGF